MILDSAILLYIESIMTQMRLFSLAACILIGLLTIIGSATQPAMEKERPPLYYLNYYDIAAIKKGVSDKLLDPTSPLFGTMQARISNSGKITVCGYVNAKNAFGGYIGNKPFVGELYQHSTGKKIQPIFTLFLLGGTRLEDYQVREKCLSAELNI